METLADALKRLLFVRAAVVGSFIARPSSDDQPLPKCGRGGGGGGRQTLHAGGHTLRDQRVNIVNVESGLCAHSTRARGWAK